MSPQQASAPRDPCGPCGMCCRAYVVPICGYDIWSINRCFKIGPMEYARALRQRQDTPHGFLLAEGGKAFILTLDKRGKMLPGAPCVFLEESTEQRSRCLIYASRPVVCQVYPMVARNGRIAEHPESLCADGSWPRSEVERPSWSDAVQFREDQFDVYAQAVDAWNHHVKQHHAAYQLRDFYSYLFRLYDRIQSNSSLFEKYVSTKMVPGREMAFHEHPAETIGTPVLHQLALKVADEIWQTRGREERQSRNCL
ncbi:YkgJ family cysteine cluster protein [Streptomyces griseorubiginosus]|uniref:YkgJ family cysteine cluster protein n=1 Tax=Streptomyces griseorubiginosus TaxID=67304 RepID=UPI0034D3E9DD